VVRRIHPGQLQKACLRLGETVLDPAVWPEIMGELCQAVAATGAALLQSDVRTLDVPRTQSFDEALSAYFRASWHLRDTRAARAVPRLITGVNVVIDQDLMTRDEVNSDPMYNEVLIPFGLKWFAGVGFRAGSALWGLTIQRSISDGPFEQQDKHALADLSRRLTEVATVSTEVGRISLSSATGALNAVRTPAVAINRSGLVLDVNSSTGAVFDDEIYIRSGRVFVGDADARAQLEKMIDRLRITPDVAAIPVDPVVVRRKTRAPVIIRVLPVHGAARTPFLGARALLTFVAAEPRSGPCAALLSKTFGLSPAEARLASIIAEGVSPQQAAEALGITRDTARNQLKAIFAKTGTHRQGELVAMLSRL
jgi:DNA-binding CsgD family transcriptional regulator